MCFPGDGRLAFKGLENEFETAEVNEPSDGHQTARLPGCFELVLEPSVFEPLKVYCIFFRYF